MISRSIPPKSVHYKQGEWDLVLRPFDPEDAEKFQQALAVTLPDLYRYMLWPVQEWNFQDCLESMVKMHGEYFMGTVFEWGCFDVRTGALLGSVGIMHTNPSNPDNWEIGYWVTSTHTKRGLGTLITQIISAVSILCLGVKRLQVGCIKENPASRRVIEKCGFKYEGTLRRLFPSPPEERIKMGAIAADEDLLYSMLPEELCELDWYLSIAKATHILPFHGPAISLGQFQIRIPQ